MVKKFFFLSITLVTLSSITQAQPILIYKDFFAVEEFGLYTLQGKSNQKGIYVNAYLGAPLLTGIFDNEKPYIDFGGVHLADGWTFRGDLGFSVSPLNITFGLAAEYAASLQFGTEITSPAILFGQRFYVIAGGPADYSPVIGLGAFGFTVKLGASFIESTYLLSDNYDGLTWIFIKHYNVENDPNLTNLQKVGKTTIVGVGVTF